MASITMSAEARTLTLADALALTTEDIERMSTPDLIQALKLLLSVLSSSQLSRIARRVLSSHEGEV